MDRKSWLDHSLVQYVEHLACQSLLQVYGGMV